MPRKTDSDRLRLRLRRVGLSDPAIAAAWPAWWSDDSEASVSAQTELRFSLARKLGLDPHSMLDDEDEPRFVWRDEASFKHLTGQTNAERAALASFGTALGAILVASAPDYRSLKGATGADLRKVLLGKDLPFLGLRDLLALSWSAGIPVVHLRVFPWSRKRMAAMAVRAGSRSAVLLARDSFYPAPIAFYLAHELGHIALAHLDRGQAIVDFENPRPNLNSDDEEENAADRFALELLTGEQEPKVLPSQSSKSRYGARGLARTAIHSSEDLGVEPGTLALCFGYSTGDWPTANAALKHIYSERKPVWKEVNKAAWAQLALEMIPDDAVDYLRIVLGQEDLP